MRCRQASHLMAARLDDHLGHAESTGLEEHLVACTMCRARWQRMYAVDQLFRSASMRSAPLHLHARVMARINRREQARRAIGGSLALTLGAATLAVLTLLPLALGLLKSWGIAPALFVGGVETITQLLVLVDAMSRMLIVLLDQFARPLLILGLSSLAIALGLNTLWIATMRRLSIVR